MSNNNGSHALPPRESWGTKVGVILAVAGSAVGLGNFLRFPGQVAENGGGAFMVPYFLAFLLVGIPVCWAEWIMGRRAGRLSGLSSSPGIFSVLTNGTPLRFLGSLGLFIPVVIYMYYVYIESWCLAYAWYSMQGVLNLQDHGAGAYEQFFNEFNGSAVETTQYFSSITSAFIFFIITFFLNFVIIYRGLSKGIETFCKYALPMLVVMAMIIVVRVITLGANPEYPEQNFINGLGFMWNPDWSQLWNPSVWIAACGQIFFSLSVGFGVIVTYSSYLTKDDDVVLSGLTASATNEFCEVCLGGLMVIPAAMIFLGTSQMQVISGQSSFGIGFITMPQIFDLMPGGQAFGAIFFFLLFLAGVTSSLSMLQPAIAFFEEGFGMNRKASVTVLAMLTFLGASIVILSPGLGVLDALDKYAGTIAIPILALFEVIIFILILRVDKGIKEAELGADMRLPKMFSFIISYISPAFLIIIIGSWIYQQYHDYFIDGVEMPTIELLSLIAMAVFFILLMILQAAAWPRMKEQYETYKSTLPAEDLD
jgi:SNF family Na+-dependent transporter